MADAGKCEVEVKDLESKNVEEAETSEVKDKSAKSSPSKIETNEALQHLMQGKRHLLVRDVHSAVNTLETACRLLAEQYGERGDPCAEAYFLYGKALLELVRLESNVLGNALDGESAEEEDEEEEGDAEDAEPAAAEDGKTEGEEEKAEGEEAQANGNSDAAEGDDDEGKEGDVSQDCDTEEGEGGEAKEGDDDEEVSNIQLAWEVLELAKIIYERQASDKARDLRLADVFLKLGEVSIEGENYKQAVDDFNNCLELQKKHLAEDDRAMAEAHYQAGIALSLENDFSEAVVRFQASVEVIQSRMQRLNRQIVDRESGTKIEHDDPFYKEENEIKDLEGLLPDIKEKIDDMREMKAEALKKMAEIFAGGAGPSGGAGSSGSAQPISPVKAIMTSRRAVTNEAEEQDKPEPRSIGHLVKRKRPSGESAEDETKRPKQENGHTTANGHTEPDKQT